MLQEQEVERGRHLHHDKEHRRQAPGAPAEDPKCKLSIPLSVLSLTTTLPVIPVLLPSLGDYGTVYN